jgi:hypothetical protein
LGELGVETGANALAIEIHILTKNYIKTPTTKERGFDIDVRSESAKHF